MAHDRDKLKLLTEEFDALVASLQGPEFAHAMREGFSAAARRYFASTLVTAPTQADSKLTPQRGSSGPDV